MDKKAKWAKECQEMVEAVARYCMAHDIPFLMMFETTDDRSPTRPLREFNISAMMGAEGAPVASNTDPGMLAFADYLNIRAKGLIIEASKRNVAEFGLDVRTPAEG